MLRSFLRHWRLVWFLTLRELKVRYRRSGAGFALTVAQPLLITLVLHIVLGPVFGPLTPRYSVYALSGVLFWGFFQHGVIASLNSFERNLPILLRLPAPKWVFPLAAVAAEAANLCLTLALLIPFLAARDRLPPAASDLAGLAGAVILASCLVLGIGLLLSPLVMLFRDMTDVTRSVLALLFYLTPIFYPVSILPERLGFLVRANPVRLVLEAFRHPLYPGSPLGAEVLAGALIASLAALALGGWVFAR